MKKEDIEVISYKPYVNPDRPDSKIIGYVNIRLPKFSNFEINHISHLQSGTKRWFNFPTYREDNLTGNSYIPYCRWANKSHNEEFFELLDINVKAFCSKNGISITEPPAAVEFPDELPF